MTDRPEPVADRATLPADALPEGRSAGATVLVASAGDPTRHALGLQSLAAVGTADDTALVVTTTESAAATVETARGVFGADGRPSFGLVDTGSKGQSLSSTLGGEPVVYTPSPADLERLVVALDELSGDGPPVDGARHLLVRSLTPVLESASPAQIRAVLRQVSDIRTGDGTTLVGVDFTAHDEAAVAALTGVVDGVLWVTGPDDALDAEYEPATGRFTVPPGSETN